MKEIRLRLRGLALLHIEFEDVSGESSVADLVGNV